jgi:hypothetical protein
MSDRLTCIVLCRIEDVERQRETHSQMSVNRLSAGGTSIHMYFTWADKAQELNHPAAGAIVKWNEPPGQLLMSSPVLE